MAIRSSIFLILLFSLFGSYSTLRYSLESLSFRYGQKFVFLFSKLDSDKDEPFIFAGVKFYPPISKSLATFGILTPTLIQDAAIWPLMAGVSAILHAETGSGKTLAYLLPLAKRLSRYYLEDQYPLQALVLAPTRELAAQVNALITA